MDILSALGIMHERINNELQIGLKSVDINVSCGHIWLLTLVYQNGGFIEIRELVRRLEKKKTTISEMVSTLERNGYLTKYRSTEDKRIYCVKTTLKAEEMKDQIFEVVSGIKDKVMNSVDPSDIVILEKMMNQMVDNLE